VKVNWFYWNGSSWIFLNVSDSTRNLTQNGLLIFAVPNDFQSLELFDKKQFWLKGSVVEGAFAPPPKVLGIWVNSAPAVQASVVADEILGSSQAVAHQKFQLLNAMIINQEVFVLESTRPSEAERQAIVKAEGGNAITEQQDESGDIQHFKIRWHEVDDFDQSGPKDRHYTVDKRLGVIAFGDGVHGMMPPPGGDNVRANYRFGGGKNGNVEAGKIAGLKNAISFVDQVTNHIRADGGSATETLDEVRTRGPQKLKHQERAMSRTDFEALAQSASRTVARAKCLVNTNDDGEHAPGHVTVIIVPDTQTQGEPPSRVLLDLVLNDLKARTAYAMSANDRIHVRGAGYIDIAVEPTIVPTTLEAAAEVEEAVIAALKYYMHPLTGGPCQDGWAFGGTVCRTELFALLEGIADVDHVIDMVIRVKGEVQADDVVMRPDQLPFSGAHKVNIQLPGAQPKPGVSSRHSTCLDVPEFNVLDPRRCAEGSGNT
jgi:predicted phage baseplate assembly protein